MVANLVQFMASSACLPVPSSTANSWLSDFKAVLSPKWQQRRNPLKPLLYFFRATMALSRPDSPPFIESFIGSLEKFRGYESLDSLDRSFLNSFLRMNEAGTDRDLLGCGL